MSTINRLNAASVIYSSLSFYGPYCGHELSGVWIVRALRDLDITPAAARQALRRLERDGALKSRRTGRIKHYALTPIGRSAAAAGRERLFGRRGRAWDGRWTLVRCLFRTGGRISRDHMRAALETEGFAVLGHGLFIHPRDLTKRVGRLARELGVTDHVVVFRARRASGNANGDPELASTLWNLRQLDHRYRRFLRRFDHLPSSVGAVLPRDAFALRFAIVVGYLDVAWEDPDLPASMLPRRWSGYDAARLVSAVYRRLQPGALAHARYVTRITA